MTTIHPVARFSMVEVSYEKAVAAIAAMGAGVVGWLKFWRILQRKLEAHRKARQQREHLLENIAARLEDVATRQIQIELTTHLIHAAQEMPLVLAGIPAWRSSPDGQCTFITPMLSDLLGLSVEQAKGWGWLSGIHAEDREPVRKEYVRSCEERRIFSRYYRYRHSDGATLYIRGTAYPVLNPTTGAVVEYWGRALEVSKQEWEERR